MEGKGYDSCSGRNYEVMRERSPVLTRDYVDYGCWWFGWMLVISFFLFLIQEYLVKRTKINENTKTARRKVIMALGICLVVSGILIVVLTMRGAGKMDYRETIAVNTLWYMVPLLLMGRGRPEDMAGPKDTVGQKGI